MNVQIQYLREKLEELGLVLMCRSDSAVITEDYSTDESCNMFHILHKGVELKTKNGIAYISVSIHGNHTQYNHCYAGKYQGRDIYTKTLSLEDDFINKAQDMLDFLAKVKRPVTLEYCKELQSSCPPGSHRCTSGVEIAVYKVTPADATLEEVQAHSKIGGYTKLKEYKDGVAILATTYYYD